MRRSDEVSKPESCLNRALDHELTFVLLGRDPCAPKAIRRWANDRIAAGKSTADDPQITEAFECAAQMEREHEAIRSDLAAL